MSKLHAPYLELDDIIYSIQKFGGASTYWAELTSRFPRILHDSIIRRNSSKFMRLYSPKSTAKIFHSSHFRVSSSRHTKNVVTIHDLIYERGLGGGLGKYVNLYERKKSVIAADAIICISKSTRNDLYEHYGKLVESKPVHVIHHGCTKLPQRPAEQASVLSNSEYSHLNLMQGQFFVFVGGRSGYKNFSLLLDAFVFGNFAEQGLSLICTGSSFNEHECTLIKNLGLTDSVKSIGFVDRNTLSDLYEVARALVYPSAYEGFGLPPLEAMAAGCPVICAKSSSLPEVVETSGILVDPSSAEQLTEAMQKVLLVDVRAYFIQAGLKQAKQFDWDDTARRHVDVYKSLASFQ
jgi:glycosyltransferase involved in cell wall biosynthesis